jgi:photosystem II stability/assembly factor-like uncharacterized protein
MKKYLLLIALISFSLNNSFAQWTNLGPYQGANKMTQNLTRTYLFGSRLYHSDDNGYSWQIENTPAVTFNDLFFLPSKILAATDKGIFVSYDNGINWISHNAGVTDSANGTRDIAQIGSRLILTSTSNIYYSDNNGDSWTLSNISGANVRQIAIVNGVILVSAFIGVYRSIDNGLTYITSNSGILGASPNISNVFCINSVAYAYKVGSIEIYKSTDNGINWLLSNSGLTGSTGSIALVNSKLYFGNVNGLKEYDTLANTWVASMLNQFISGNIIHFYNNKYYGMFSNSPNLIATLDNGQSWQESDSGVLMAGVGKLISTENNKLFGISSGLFLFDEVGNFWNRFSPFNYDFGGTLLSTLNTQILCISYGAGNKYYIGTNGGVWSSADNGFTWIQHHTGLPITNTPAGYKTVKDLYINGNAIIAATTSGIYRSTDQANTWTQVSTLACNDFQKYGSYLYATGNGVFRSNDNGLTWTAFAGATSGGPFLYITGAGGKIFTSPQASGPTSLTVYADTLASSFTTMTSNIGDAYGYGGFLFTKTSYLNTSLSLTSFTDMSDNLPCYFGSVALGCYEPYANANTVFGDNLWLGTSGFSTWYRSLADFGFPVGLNNAQTEKLEIKPYPNPANEIIYFNNLTKADQIEIFNNLGQLQRITLNVDNNGLDISNLAKGFYIYTITDEQHRTKSTGKFIKD